MNLGRCLLPVLLTLPAVPAAADTLTDLLPPGTNIVIGIRVHNLAISSVAQTFAAPARDAAAGWLKAVPLDGIDLLRDVDEVLIATSGKGQNPPAIIVVTGRFDVARLAEGAKRYHEVPLLTGEAESDAVVAFLEPGIALIGDPALVRAAIDQRRGSNRIDSALNDRITSLRQRYDIWGLGNLPEGFTAPLPEAKILESIDRFQFGMQLASGLELGAEIHARASADAEKLHTAFDMMAALVKGQGQSPSAARFDLQADGGTMKLTVFIPDEELKRTIEAETAALSPVATPSGSTQSGSNQSSSTQSAAPASAPAAAPEPQETGPNGTADMIQGPPAAPQETTAPPATPPAIPPTAPKPGPSLAGPSLATNHAKVPDQSQDTVILTLPGKK